MPAGAGSAPVTGLQPRFCPACAADLTGPHAFVQEFWSAADRLFFCWCPGCRTACTVSIGDRVTSHEPSR